MCCVGANGYKETAPATAPMENATPTKAPSPGMPTGGQPVSEVDLQARAAEEFAKGLRTGNDDSSDEDEAATKTSKPKFRIQINAKPAGSTPVDASLLRAATQQFKIGDGLTAARPSVSRPPQDPFPPLALPAPASSMAAQQPPVLMQPEGTGQGSAPIPEDFWKQTTSATAVAKAFEQTGTLLPQAIAGSQGGQPPQVSYELPGGGVPPQQPETSAALSLPGGGVPPQPLSAEEIAAANLKELDSSLDPAAAARKKLLLEQQKQQQLLDLVGGPKPAQPPPVAPSTAFVKRNQVINF